MATYSGNDGTRLAYHRSGDGPVVICLPGGPMQAAAYLDDLGGLSADLSLVLPDLRGTGDSSVPADPATYRCDRLVDDVEALRVHLGLDRMDLLAHSAGANLAVLYAARYPERIGRLALITPSPLAVGVPVTDRDRRRLAELRIGEPWFADAFAAFENIWAGDPSGDDWDAITPFVYGRWDAAAQAHVAREALLRNDEAAAVFNAPEAFDPPATRAALAGLPAPVLLLAGEYDVVSPPTAATAYAALFRTAELVVQPGSGHLPWLDDPAAFVRVVAPFFVRS